MNLDLLHKKIQTISTESGVHFYALSNTFPQLIEEINPYNNTTSKSGNKLSEFKRVQHGLEKSVEKQQNLLAENRQFMTIFQEKNKELFQSFANGIRLLENMNESILKIKDESQEMEVISLNAMIVSIKSGKQGQAFSYITSNLKRLSYQLIAQSEKLISIDEQVQKDIHELKQLTEDAEIDDTDINAEQIKNSKELLDAFHTVEYKISEMIETAGAVQKPLLDAMEGIQMQDIIRQSLDDVTLAITKIREYSHIEDPEERLNRINENIQLVDVAKACITSISAKLLNSISVFTENSSLINNILEQVDTMHSQLFIKRTHIIDGNKNSAIETLQSCMQHSIQDFNKNMDIIQSYHAIQENILNHSKKIQIEVQKIQLCFDDFAPIIKNLMYVAIAQRIEIARTAAISSIRDTVEYMATLVSQTNQNIQHAQDELEEFSNISFSQVKHFTNETNKNKIWFSKILIEKNNFSDEMQYLEEDMIAVMRQFTVYSESFISLYTETKERIRELETLAELLSTLQTDLTVINLEFTKEKNHLLKTHPIEDKPVHNDDVLEFLRNFTITEDKKEVGVIVGLEIEQGVDAGEITFF